MENPAGKLFGRYEIVGELGRGAMGVVYKARDPQIDRLVALKTVPLRGHEPEAETEYRLRFLNEAKAAGRLHHPGIVAVFDVGEEPEHHDPYIVLEYVAGEALNRNLAREKKLPLAKALQFAVEIAEALDYAHAQGVIHRDIKPGNILITPDGHPKIADFGIAKLNLAHFTLPGKVLGTPAYMAPEQLAGEGVDGRSDLFSLGVILYAMVAGHSPFQGDSATTVCFKVANREPVPASALDLNLPRELDDVIARAMAKDPAQRYQRGAEFAESVRQLQALGQSGSTTTSITTISGSGTRKVAKEPSLSRPPAVGLAYAAKLIRAEFLKSPVKDLILGVATVVLLMIVGVQSKLLVSTQEETADPGLLQEQPVPARPVNASQVPANAGASSSANAGSVPTTPAIKATVRKASGKARVSIQAKAQPTESPAPALQPVKQVVVSLSTIELAVRHQFKDATLSVWIDDKLALTRPLHGGTQKRLVVFNGVRGIESETMKVPAGKHTLRFRTQTADQTTDLSKTISAEFIGGNDKTLQISFDKHNTSMHLDWQ
jgi:serine/threonine protein kinase